MGGDKVRWNAVGGVVNDAVEAVIATQVVHAGVTVAAAENRLHGSGCVYVVVAVVWGCVVWLGGIVVGGDGKWSCWGYCCRWCC